MVAVDSNILIGVLAILSVLAYVFVLRKMKTEQPDSAGIVVSTEKTDEKTVPNESEPPRPQPSKEPSEEKSVPECRHHFGFLSTLPKRSKTPKECLQCCRMTECMKRKKPRKSRDNQVEAVLATDEETLQSLNKKPSEKKNKTTEKKIR
jgi:hypothetical protein